MPQHSILHVESQPYEELSSFIQIFRRAITTVELLSFSIEKGNSLSNCLRTAWELVEEIRQLESRYLKGQSEMDSMTFGRFLYRLIEIIGNCKIKYQYTGSNPHDEALERFLKEAEAVVRSVRQTQASKSFASIISLTKFILLKYCNKIMTIDQANCEDKDEKSLDVRSKIKEEYCRVKEIQKITAPRVFFLIANAETQKNEQSSITEKQSAKLITNQTFSEMRKRFDRYSGMDLDFPYFRSSYFEAKSNYDAFYKDYLNRNSCCLSILETYSSHFQVHAKRRELRTIRRDRAERIGINPKRESFNCIRENKQHQVGSKSKRPIADNQVEREVMSMNMSAKYFRKQEIKSKSNRKERDTKDSRQSDSFSRKTFQSNHHVIIGGVTNKNSGEINQQNLENEAQKSFFRLKTQADKRKGQLSEQNLKKGASVRGLLSCSGKGWVKMKYFEMKWLPDVMQECAKSRMMFNNKFCIKHTTTRTKNYNWLEKKVER